MPVLVWTVFSSVQGQCWASLVSTSFFVSTDAWKKTYSFSLTLQKPGFYVIEFLGPRLRHVMEFYSPCH